MIDLRSDTVTRPGTEMRNDARDAAVGDDVYGEDPTVNELEKRAAEVVGKEAAMFVPTGTMGNQAAVRTHTDRGEEVLIERESHVYKWEVAGLAQLSGVQPRTIDGGDRGVITPEAIEDGYVAEDLHRPGTGLLCVENTHNSKGGTAISPERIDAAAETAHDLGFPVHVDGARVMNAAIALDVSPARLVSAADSVMFCLSKGLGAPVGSVLAGSEEFIERARRHRKLFGGGMRQAGIVAAPGLRALDNRNRLAEDHEHARELAAGLDSIPSLSVHEPETNIVLVETEVPAADFLSRAAEVDVLGVPFGEHVVRFCTHLDVSRADVDTAVDRLATELE
ncbi:low specificity L-threonine aldolase [Halobacteriales archaeon QH_6_64_20]|jgi:threonine aldolase|nr:MAG: low specificity L-threonine aldolase [Halobacteriales archaeon QH_6_64_20]